MLREGYKGRRDAGLLLLINILPFIVSWVYAIHVRTLHVSALPRQQSSITWIFPTLLGHIYGVIHLRM